MPEIVNLSSIAAKEFVLDRSLQSAFALEALNPDPLAEFLNRALCPDRFVCLVLTPRKKTITQCLLRVPEMLPVVLTNLEEVMSRMQMILPLVSSGFRVLIALSEPRQSLQRHIIGLGFQDAGESTLDADSEHNPLKASWNQKELITAVNTAFARPVQSVCLFGHDGDPLYVLTKS